MQHLSAVSGIVYFLLIPLADPHATAAAIQHEQAFVTTPYGRTPAGWFDAHESRPSRAWVVDGEGWLRQVLKKQFGPYPDDRSGLLLFEGEPSVSGAVTALTDGKVSARFKKTEDDPVFFGIAARASDKDNYYLARFSGSGRLELLKIKAGVWTNIDLIRPVAETELLSISGTRPPGTISLSRYSESDLWTLSFQFRGDILTATVQDGEGREQATVEARDGDFLAGYVGFCCTRFAATASVRIEGESPKEWKPLPGVVNRFLAPDYTVVRPHWDTLALDTPRAELDASYDLIVAGGGTGGFGAALQAARLGAKVLILEETDWLGGQMAAGVTTMDEASGWWKYPVRERGIYREFHESMVTYYQTLDKDPMLAYYTYPHQTEGGYEPRGARAVFYGFIKDQRDRGSRIDVSLRSRVVQVKLEREAVRGVTVEFEDAGGISTRDIACTLLVDATEYGDVIPLTGARYRSGNTISPDIELGAPVQDHTWLAIVREYPGGVPEHLRMPAPPPGYDRMRRFFSRFQQHGFQIWGPEGKGLKPPVHWRRYFAWRGLADSASPLTGVRSTERHTRSGFNGGNDYPVTAATLEDPAQRLIDERDGIYRSLALLYYFQQELGLPWALAEDEGYDTLYNQRKMKRLDLRPDLLPLAVHLPQQPYVRESRRIVGLHGLSGNDLEFRDDQAKLFPTSVAMGDYGMDLDHGDTANAIEPDLDSGDLARHSGPFMVPFECFIPEKVDGFIAAEKNISQSRRASGATRMQPSTMLTGQAAGAIAALALQHGVQPRQLNPVRVQSVLLDAGSTLVPRWHVDVPFRSPVWKATQLLTLYQVMDRPGNLTHDRGSLGASNAWGVDQPLRSEELANAIKRLAQICGAPEVTSNHSGPTVPLGRLRETLESIRPDWVRFADELKPVSAQAVTAGEFALVAARCLLEAASAGRISVATPAASAR